MTDQNSALASLRAFLTDPSEAHAEAVRAHLADDLKFAVHTTNENGLDAAVLAFRQSLFHHVVFGGEWKDASVEGDVVTQVLSMPAKGIAAGCTFRFTFNEDAKVQQVEGGWILPPAELAPEPVVLSTAMHARLNRAEQERMPVLFAYLTPDGRPEQIYRDSTHTLGDDRLAFWNPRPDGSFLDSIAANSRVSAIYRHDHTHEMLEMSGRARIVEDAVEARRIYDARSEFTHDADPSRRGVAVIVELDRVTGLMHSAETGAIERILMVRAGGSN